MAIYDGFRRSSKSPTPTRWRAYLNPRPALSRRQILDRRAVAHLSDADKAYLEAYDILSAYPGQLESIYRGLADAAVETQRGGIS